MLVRFFFENCENVHIQPSWWGSLAKEAQGRLISHMDVNSEFESRDLARKFFSDDNVEYNGWLVVKRYMAS